MIEMADAFIDIEGAQKVPNDAEQGRHHHWGEPWHWLALVERFLAEGASVVACARTAERLEALKQSVGAAPLEIVAGDAADPTDVASIVARAREAFGGVDVLVNNAGAAGPTTPVASLSLSDWNETLASNLTSAFLFVRETAPLMTARGGGAIVNIGSMTGKSPWKTARPTPRPRWG